MAVARRGRGRVVGAFAGQVLAINRGSASVRFALFEPAAFPRRLLAGRLERVGMPGTSLSYKDLASDRCGSGPVSLAGHRSPADFLIDWLEERIDFSAVAAIGYRIATVVRRCEAQLVSAELLQELRAGRRGGLHHASGEIELVEAFGNRYPHLPQVACFDTAFHRDLPEVARQLPLAAAAGAGGDLVRCGFHGLSYRFLLQELRRQVGARAAAGRIILAHLGSSASLTAVQAGRSVETSMGFSPCGGIPMATRPGDLDPGLIMHLLAGGLGLEGLGRLLEQEAGLLAVSGRSGEMRELLQLQVGDAAAGRAVELFCYSVRKCIGAFAAVLGGLETLVFSGGIGANAAEVRRRVCAGLGFLGLALSEEANRVNAAVISTPSSAVSVRVMASDEEQMIATSVGQLLAGGRGDLTNKTTA